MAEHNFEKEKRRKPGGMGPGGHGPGGMAPPEKAKNFKVTLKKLVKYLSDFHVAIVIVFIFTAASTLFSVVGPKILGKATAEILNG